MLKKQFHKATQFVCEKIYRVERTKLDEEFLEMERKVDATGRAVVDLLTKCTEYLQPNPAYRMKLGMQSTISKITGQTATSIYPQPEGILGDSMLQFGKELGDDSMFGQALLDFGEAMKMMSEVKDSLHFNVKQNFFDPLRFLQENDLKIISNNLKKMETRRLEYDYKRRRVPRVSSEEMQNTIKRFEESKDLASSDMHNLLDNDIEQVNQLAVFIEAVLNYHKQSAQILLDLQMKLQHRYNYKASTASTFRGDERFQAISFRSENSENPAWSSPSFFLDRPCCRALYDFIPENEGELGFKEGDIIVLTGRIDENWFDGILNEKSGCFPVNYVSVLVPLGD